MLAGLVVFDGLDVLDGREAFAGLETFDCLEVLAGLATLFADLLDSDGRLTLPLLFAFELALLLLLLILGVTPLLLWCIAP